MSLLQATWNSTLRVGEYFCRRSSGTTLGRGAAPPRPASCILARSIRGGCGTCDPSLDNSTNETPIARPTRATDPLTIQIRRENVCKMPYLSVRLSSVHDFFARALGQSAESQYTRTPGLRTPPRKPGQSGAAVLRVRPAQVGIGCNNAACLLAASLWLLATGWHGLPNLSSSGTPQSRIYSAPNQQPILERRSQLLRGNLSEG